jgi:proprotein convertase subtilisin/kexin type 5
MACKAGYLLNSDFFCSDSCPFRHYMDFTIKSCQPCPLDCLICSSDGYCLSCSPSDFRVLNRVTNRCVPQAGYFENQTQQCASCPRGCSNCQSELICLSCQVGYYLSGVQCVSTCGDRFVGVRENSRCSRCPYDCLNCDPSGNCL